MTFELELDVPESREVTLPPEVPVGRVKLTVRPPDEQVVEFRVTLPEDQPRVVRIPSVFLVRDQTQWERHFEPQPHFVLGEASGVPLAEPPFPVPESGATE